MNSIGEYSSYNTPSSSSSNTFASANPASSSFGNTTDMFSNKNNIIILLLILVVLSFLGINLLAISGNVLEELSKIFGPSFKSIASMLGYSTGQLINTTADIGADTAKLGIDIAEGSAQSVGNLLKNASKGGIDNAERRNLELALTSSKSKSLENTPEPSQSAGTIHRSISSKKGGWCFIGEDAGTRGCVSIDEHDKCMSGQIFPSKESCMNNSE